MSTNYQPIKRIQINELFGGSLDKFGISEFVGKHTRDSHRCLTDGESFLWVGVDSARSSVGFTRYGSNTVGGILSAVSEVFDTEIAGEHDPEFWGFKTQEEWDVYMLEDEENEEDKFYAEMMKLLRGEPNDLADDTDTMRKAKIAKTLVTRRPFLASPDKKWQLLYAISRAKFMPSWSS